MCYYRLYLYSVCGHFHWGKFLAHCKDAARQAYLQQPYHCAARQRHPYQTLRIHTLCLMCIRERERSEHLLHTSNIGDNVKGIEPTFLRKQSSAVLQSPKRRSLGTLRREMKAEMLRQRARSETRPSREEQLVDETHSLNEVSGEWSEPEGQGKEVTRSSVPNMALASSEAVQDDSQASPTDAERLDQEKSSNDQ